MMFFHKNQACLSTNCFTLLILGYFPHFVKKKKEVICDCKKDPAMVELYYRKSIIGNLLGTIRRRKRFAVFVFYNFKDAHRLWICRAQTGESEI
jgi:hypothetical protein